MATKAEQIAARVATVLLNTTAAGTNVYRDRQDAFTREESPALLIELADEQSTPLGGGRIGMAGDLDQDVLSLAVITCVRGANWQSVADGVRVQAHALLLADATLRGLLASIRRDRCEWKAASADQPFGYCAQIYAIKYLTRAHALDQAV
jgi:hypothetical protein